MRFNYIGILEVFFFFFSGVLKVGVFREFVVGLNFIINFWDDVIGVGLYKRNVICLR